MTSISRDNLLIARQIRNIDACTYANENQEFNRHLEFSKFS